jgi:hypothetical protein
MIHTDPARSSAAMRLVNIGAVAFGHVGQSFARGRIIGRKGFPRRRFEPLAADQHLPGLAHKGKDLLVSRDFHRCRAHGVSPLWMCSWLCQVRKTEYKDTTLYMNGNTVIIARGWNPVGLSF